MRKIRRSRAISVAACALVLGVAAMAQDASAPILSHSFEENDGGWQALGGSAMVSLTHDEAAVKSGKGALQYNYAIKKGEFTLLLLPTPDRVLSKAKSLRFWVKSDHAGPLGVVMQEKDGGHYNAVFSTPKNMWQQVELSTADFVLDTSKDAPKDPDGKLDLDAVEGVGIADMAQIFVQSDPALASALGISEGPRKLYLDDFSVTATAIPPGATLKNGEGSFDTFARPQIGWISVGELALSRVTGKPLEGAGLQAKYHQAPSKIAGISRSVPAEALTGATKLTLSAASLKPAKIIVQVEEKSGGKYNTMVELPGNSGRADLSINFSEFKAAQDSHDDNNKLDMDKISQIIFIDATGLLDNTDGDNILWLNNLKAVK